jgi:hypothetical protein
MKTMTADELCDQAFNPGDTDNKRRVRKIVNAHDDLVAAVEFLKTAMKWLERCGAKSAGDYLLQASDKITAALAKAEGGAR